MRVTFLAVVSSLWIATTFAFTVVVTTTNKLHHGSSSSLLPRPKVGGIQQQQQQHFMLPDSNLMTATSSIILSAVEIFDGSTVVDPVVVSDVFWTSLQSKIVAVIIGQILATIVFAILANFLASQISQLGDVVTKTLFPNKESTTTTTQKTFIKANEINNISSRAPDFGKLLICLTIDVLGSSNELIPVVGEVVDVVYAPIAATILRNLYGGSNIIFALEFGEEILPFTDILPLATICWTVDTFFPSSDLAKLLKLGDYNAANFAPDSIDTRAETLTDLRLPTGRSTIGDDDDDRSKRF